MIDAEKRVLWKRAEENSMLARDSSCLNGRCVEGKLPWAYRAKIFDFLKPDSRILDMETGDAEFLLSLRYPFHLTSVTEESDSALRLCEEKLSPLGITVKQAQKDQPLPYEDAQFDLVFNRHANYTIQEVRRVLKPGGYFITQQVGGSNSLPLRNMLCGEIETALDFNLENEILRFQSAGFSINYKNQCYKTDRYLDTETLVRYAKMHPQEFPGFSVDACFDRLLKVDALCEKQGYIPNVQHRFILIARKRK